MALLAGGAPLNIAGGVREFARASPETVAIVDDGHELTFRALDDRSSRLASGLLAAGLRTGEPVGVLLDNRSAYLEIAAGLAKAGLPIVPLNPRSAPAELRQVLAHSGAAGLVVEERHTDALPGDLAGVRLVLSLDGETAGPSYERFLDHATPEDPHVPVGDEDPFCLAYTSGTTGQPKGVVLSHRSRVLTFYAAALEWHLGIGRRSLAVAPMCHGAGLTFAYAPLFCGGTVVVLPRWDPEHLLDLAGRERVQTSFLVPTHAQQLRALGEDALRTADLTALDTLYFNAAALPVGLKHWVMDSLPHVGVHELYGSTEGGVVTDLRPPDARRKAGTVGRPWFMTSLRIVGADGAPVAPGEPGELFSRSPFLMSGYLHDPDATAACTTDDGFLSAGDVAVADDEGFISIVDRRKDMIVTGGVNVYPREVEQALALHPAIVEAAVVGAPDEEWGERITAFIVPAGGEAPPPGELERHLGEHLARYKHPRSWHVVEELPRNVAGKVRKQDLRAALASPVTRS